jgi:hypothetical protein
MLRRGRPEEGIEGVREGVVGGGEGIGEGMSGGGRGVAEMHDSARLSRGRKDSPLKHCSREGRWRGEARKGAGSAIAAAGAEESTGV